MNNKTSRVSLKLFMLILFVFYNSSCSSSRREFEIDESQFCKIVTSQKLSLIYVWTEWCPISKKTIPELYYHLEDSLKANGLDSIAIIIITPTRNIENKIKVHRENGISNSHTIKSNLINFGITDRIIIKKFLVSSLGDSIVEKLTNNKTSYGIPLEFIINKEKKLVSPFIPRNKKEIIKYLKNLKIKQQSN